MLLLLLQQQPICELIFHQLNTNTGTGQCVLLLCLRTLCPTTRQPNIMSSHFCCCRFTTTTTTTAADQLPRICCSAAAAAAAAVHRSGKEEEERRKNDKIYDTEQRRLQRRRKTTRATTKGWRRQSQQLLQPLTTTTTTTTTISDSPEFGVTRNSSFCCESALVVEEEKDASEQLQPPKPVLHSMMMMIHCRCTDPGTDNSGGDKINRNSGCGHLITTTISSTATLHHLLLDCSSVHYHQQKQHQQQPHCLNPPRHPRPANEGNDFQKSEHPQREENVAALPTQQLLLLLFCMMSPRHHHHHHHQQHQHASLALICLHFFFSSFSSSISSSTFTVAPLDDDCCCSFSFYARTLLQNLCCCCGRCLLTTGAAEDAMNINELCHRWLAMVLVLAVNFSPLFLQQRWPTFASFLRTEIILYLKRIELGHCLHHQNSREISDKKLGWFGWWWKGVTLGGDNDDFLATASLSPLFQGQIQSCDRNEPRKSAVSEANQLISTTSQTVNLNNATNGDLFALCDVNDDQPLPSFATTGDHLSSRVMAAGTAVPAGLPPLPLPTSLPLNDSPPSPPPQSPSAPAPGDAVTRKSRTVLRRLSSPVSTFPSLVPALCLLFLLLSTGK